MNDVIIGKDLIHKIGGRINVYHRDVEWGLMDRDGGCKMEKNW